MNKDFLNEESRIDNFFKDKIKKDIFIPEKLEHQVMERIFSTKILKRSYLFKISIPIVSIFIIALGLMIYVPTINVYAEKIPIISTFIRLFKDTGISNAINHGYQPSQTVSVEQNDYKLSIETVTIDENKLVIMVVVSNEKKPQVFEVDADFDDFEYNRNVSLNGQGTAERKVGVKIEKFFVEGELENFLNKKPRFIKVNFLLYKSSENLVLSAEEELKTTEKTKYIHFNSETDIVLQEIKDVQIPVDISRIQYSKVFNISKIVNFNDIDSQIENLNIKKLSVSPSRIRLIFSCDMKSGLFFNKFINVYLKDGKGSIYSNVYSMDIHSQGERVLDFAPSFYFDELPDELFLCFDGISVLDSEQRLLEDEIKKEISILIND